MGRGQAARSGTVKMINYFVNLRLLVASFLNLSATVSVLKMAAPENLLLICAGTSEEASLEDLIEHLQVTKL